MIHTAGPFQAGEPQVLRAAISARTSYLDVCDDTRYAAACRRLGPSAREAGIAGVTTGGIYPGVSNVMAAALVNKMREQGLPPDELVFSYFTAGCSSPVRPCTRTSSAFVAI